MPQLTTQDAESLATPAPGGDGSPAARQRSHKARTRKARRPPLAMKRTRAAAFCGFSLPTWDRMSAAGLNPAGSKLGGSRYYRTAELVAWVCHGFPRRAEWESLWDAMQKRRNRR
jgi:hypothetical protein